MNILYTCDNNFVWLMSISMISLFKSNIEAGEINVYLIGENITEENKKILNNIACIYNRHCIIIDLPNIKIPENLYTNRWPRSAYTRLFCGEILPLTVDKILYLDCDTIVKESLSELYNDTTLNKYTICGVKDCISNFYKKNIGLSKECNYINAGVLLINVKELREKNVFNKIEKCINKYKQMINYADQDILNCIFNDEIGVLNPKYNVMTLEFSYSYKNIIKLRRPGNYYTEKEINDAINKPYIIHYTTNMTVIRPWFNNSNHPRKDDFINIYRDGNYFNKEFNTFSTNNYRYIFLKILLNLKSIGYFCIGCIHSEIVPLLKRVKCVITKK